MLSDHHMIFSSLPFASSFPSSFLFLLISILASLDHRHRNDFFPIDTPFSYIALSIAPPLAGYLDNNITLSGFAQPPIFTTPSLSDPAASSSSTRILERIRHYPSGWSRSKGKGSHGETPN